MVRVGNRVAPLVVHPIAQRALPRTQTVSRDLFVPSGTSIYLGLKRAIQLVSSCSLHKKEIMALLQDIRQGCPLSAVANRLEDVQALEQALIGLRQRFESAYRGKRGILRRLFSPISYQKTHSSFGPVLDRIGKYHEALRQKAQENSRTCMGLMGNGQGQQALSLINTQQVDLTYVSDEGRLSLLHVAVYFGCQDLVQVLLAKGLDPNKPDAFGNTPLFYAFSRGDIQQMEMLFSYGCPLR